jgi:hypothetical protein
MLIGNCSISYTRIIAQGLKYFHFSLTSCTVLFATPSRIYYSGYDKVCQSIKTQAAVVLGITNATYVHGVNRFSPPMVHRLEHLVPRPLPARPRNSIWRQAKESGVYYSITRKYTHAETLAF